MQTETKETIKTEGNGTTIESQQNINSGNNGINTNNNNESNKQEMDALQYKAGVAFGIFNFIAGILLVLSAIRFQICSWFRGGAGLTIIYLSLTPVGCEQYCLKWFPLWQQGNLLFMGSIIVFLSCSGIDMLYHQNWKDTPTWNQILIVGQFFNIAVGVIYIILYPIQRYVTPKIPNALPIKFLFDGCCNPIQNNDNNNQNPNNKAETQQLIVNNNPPQKTVTEQNNDVIIETKIIESKPDAVVEPTKPTIAEQPKAAEPQIIQAKPQIITE
mmetsp:Transcript_75910/g.93217  ORF Transcript_75910/g.93217 Transcript_75910/m.93217 type:complete len:272 (-) Transcript_75910:164-979(-)